MHKGHDFLWKEFQVKPKIGWMIDSFGHSAANAELFQDFGFEALFFSRINEPMRDELKKDKKMTFVWQPS